jgi:hypothetical protein
VRGVAALHLEGEEVREDHLLEAIPLDFGRVEA